MKLLNTQQRLEQERASLKVLSDNAQKDHMISVEGLELVVYKEVFSPHFFNGWRTYTPKLRELVKKGEDLLEVGVGNGITSVLLAKDGVNVTASDISSFAVDNTKLNFKQNGLKHNGIFLSDVYDGLCQDKKFDAIYWNCPWMETIENDRIDGVLGYGLFDNGFHNTERFIKEAKYYLKPNGRLYMGHADFGDYQRLEKLLTQYGFSYEIVVSEPSVEIRDVEFYMYEAKLIAKQNNIFIAMPFTGNSFEKIVKTREHYQKITSEFGLNLLEQFIGREEKEKFEQAQYQPEFIVNKDFELLDQAHILLVDLSDKSIGACFEMSYAKSKRKIPIIGFACSDGKTKRHPWYGYYCDEIVETIEEALEITRQYCK